MSIGLIVTIAVSLLAVIGILLLFGALKRTRRKARAADVADLKGIAEYASSRKMTIQLATSKQAFTATGTLEGIPVSLTTSPLKLVAAQGHVAVGPIETHLQVRGLPSDLRLLIARPVQNRGQVENPLQRGADLLPTGDASLDSIFQCFASSPTQLRDLLAGDLPQRIVNLPEMREVRLSDGELSISLTPSNWFGGPSDSKWYHVRPLVRHPETLDNAARLLAELHRNTTQLV